MTISKNAEELFQEIMNNSNKNVDWEKRFEKLNSSEDTTLRNLFKELIDANLIKVYWADNIPYHIEILSNWQTYINKQRHYVDSPKNIFTNNFYGTVTNTQFHFLLIRLPNLKFCFLQHIKFCLIQILMSAYNTLFDHCNFYLEIV